MIDPRPDPGTAPGSTAQPAADHGSGSALSVRRDVVLPLGIASVHVFGTLAAVERGADAARPLDLAGWFLLVAGPLALTARSRRPAVVFLVVLATTVLYYGWGYPRGPAFAGLVVAVLSAGVAGHRRLVWVSTAVGLAGYFALATATGSTAVLAPASVAGHLAWVLVVLTGAELARARAERVAAARRARAEAARRRADEERLAIARDLHDVLGHSLSLISVQAGVALAIMDERPEQAKTALTAILQVSRDALAEVRATLGALRQGGTAPLQPSEALSRLDGLVSTAAAAGLHVDLRVRGEPRSLPATVDLAAFRVVQEAVTNVLRHSRAREVLVELEYEATRLTVRVGDAGPAAHPGDVRSGGGLAGMRERTEALGGTFTAGPRSDGGFAIAAVLPLAGASPVPAPGGGSGRSDLTSIPDAPARSGRPGRRAERGPEPPASPSHGSRASSSSPD